LGLEGLEEVRASESTTKI